MQNTGSCCSSLNQRKTIFLFLLHITFIFSLSWGCDSKQQADFTASSTTVSDDVIGANSGPITESFTVKVMGGEESARPIHMLWALDNSHSMKEEIAGVNAGVKAFAEGLKQYSKIKTTMITKTGGDLGVEAATLKSAGIHIVDFTVESLEQLSVLASYLIHTHKLEKEQPLFLKKTQSFNLHPDADFFRDPKALKVFVVVTDDEDEYIYKLPTGQLFLSLIQNIYGDLSLFRFFAFLDLKEPRLNDPSHKKLIDDHRRGNKSYNHMVHELGGGKWHIVDISPDDWKQVLNQVHNSIVSEVLQKTFTLKHAVAEILEVKVAETILEAGSYQLEGPKLHVTASHLKEGDQIKVSYNAQGS